MGYKRDSRGRFAGSTGSAAGGFGGIFSGMSQRALGDQFRAHVGDDAHVAPRAFGPGGKYTTKPVDMWGRAPYNASSATAIEAVHTSSGRRIGTMSWHEPAARRDGTHIPHAQGSEDPSRSAIHKVFVSPNMRRKGVASAMLAHGRDLRPGLQHSGKQALSGDGAAWAQGRP